VTPSKFSEKVTPHGVGIGVAVGGGMVAVGVGDGVKGVGVGVGVSQKYPLTTILSTRHPVALMLLSDAIRKRSFIALG
jgi:hypothetical protein